MNYEEYVVKRKAKEAEVIAKQKEIKDYFLKEQEKYKQSDNFKKFEELNNELINIDKEAEKTFGVVEGRQISPVALKKYVEYCVKEFLEKENKN